jgi:ankyrin repeat protein
VSYAASGGSLAMLEALAQFPAVDFNFPDKEGNAPLHFAAQAGKLLFGARLFSSAKTLCMKIASGEYCQPADVMNHKPIAKVHSKRKSCKILIFTLFQYS